MKILLTGAAGFIGSHVARKLVAEGCDVYALIRPGSNTWRISDIVRSLSIVPCDLLSTQQLDQCLERIRPDLCIHLAWYVEHGRYQSSLENIRFLSASLELATRLTSFGCSRFVGAGTCFEYDTDLGYLSESSPTVPRTLYAASKLGLYLALDQLGKETGLDVVWLRLFYVYGPREDERRLVPSVICSLLRNREAKVTKGHQMLDFLHVEDVAAGIWAVARSNLSGPVNIGSGRPVAVRDIITKIGVILDRLELIALGALPDGDSGPVFVCANNRRLAENTAWTPHYDLEKGLRQTIKWWRAHLAVTSPGSEQVINSL